MCARFGLARCDVSSSTRLPMPYLDDRIVAFRDAGDPSQYDDL